MNSENSIEPNCCPLCGKPNLCGMAAGGSAPCWCRTLTVPPELLERLPPEARGKACICRACIEAYLEEKEGK